jgi:DNA-binding response OmpR family regulator
VQSVTFTGLHRRRRFRPSRGAGRRPGCVAGYRTLHAGNGRTALSLAHERRPDAVVLDIGMPEMDGIAVCRHLQQYAGTANIPVLMLSARVRDADVELGYTAGADDYMVKPFSPQDLLHRIEGLLMLRKFRDV